MGTFALEGPLLGSDFVRGQSVLTRWATWKKLYPNTRVLNRPAGSTKNYLQDPYANYRKSDRLLYESCFEQHRTDSPYRLKDTKEVTMVVFTDRGNSHLFPISEVSVVQNIDDLDDEYFIVLWDKDNMFSLAYNRVVNGTRLSFIHSGSQLGGDVRLPLLKDRLTGSVWNASGTCISGSLRGWQLRRLTSFMTYWSAATSFFPKSQIWQDNTTLQYFPTSCPKPTSETTCSVPCSSIIAAGPAMDTIKSIDSPTFMTPSQFEAIVRIPKKTIAFYSLYLSLFIALAGSMYGYNLYHRFTTKPMETVPLDVASSASPGPNGPGPSQQANGATGLRATASSAKQPAKEPAPKLPSVMVLKEDDEEEPALPPETPSDIPKFATPTNPTRRRKRNKKHGRSTSMINEEQNSVQLDLIAPPLTARGIGPSRSKFSSLGLPRLSLQPWQNSSEGSGTTPKDDGPNLLPRNKSDSSLADLATATSSASSTAELPSVSPSLSSQSSMGLFNRSKKPSTPYLGESSPSLVHKPSTSILPTPRSGFDAALVTSQEYSTSIDSDMPDNYQISLTSVQSDEDLPEHIMSASALARIKGTMKKSPSVLASQVFQPIAEGSEPEDREDGSTPKRPDVTDVELDY
jgi:hypothetical protein